jgi:hypothetical protein
VAHVRIQRFAAGDGQHDARENRGAFQPCRTK